MKQFRETIYSWATTDKTDFKKILRMCDALKNRDLDKTLAIIAPSFIMHKINYASIINNPNVKTMIINNGYLMPGTEKCDYYLPFTTINKTRIINGKSDYVAWLNRFKGLVMHGMHYNDGTNAANPYILASQAEVKEIIGKCPNTNFSIWHHSWGDYVKKRGVPGMLECPSFEQWTPRRIPWGHCGAISGFAIPLALTLGFKKIYIVGMGYRYVCRGYHNAPKNIKEADQSKVAECWLQFAPKRFSNQAKLAENNNVVLKVGPSNLLEPELKKYFKTFQHIEDIC